MAGATLASISEILKEMYLPAVRAQLNQKILLTLGETNVTEEEALLAEWVTLYLREQEASVTYGRLATVSPYHGAPKMAERLGFRQPDGRFSLPPEHPLAA